MNNTYLKLGELLLAHRAITEAQLEAALELQANSSRRLGEILIDHGFVDEGTIASCLAHQYGCDLLDPAVLAPEQKALEVMDPIEALAKRVLPVRLDDHEMFCVIADPLNLPVTDDLVQRVKRPIRIAVAPESRLLAAIRIHFGLTDPADSAEFGACLPERYVEPEFRGRTGEVAWADVTDLVLGRKVTMFRAPDSGAESEEHWDLVRDASIRYDSRFVPIHDSILHKGFRWTSFELIRGESLGAALRRRGARTPVEAAEIVSEVARSVHESAAAYHRRTWLCPENIWIDGNRVSIAPALPVPAAYADLTNDVEALASLLLHCLTGSFNLRGLESPTILSQLPPGMRRVLDRCSKRREDERFESAKELSIALMSFQWATATQSDAPQGLDREELLATLQVVTPRRTSIWSKIFGRRAA